MKIGVIILARMDSRRLPGKALVNIAGRSLIGRVIDICRKLDNVQEIILATSDRPVDEPLAEVAAQENIAVHRGAVDDVAGRFLGAMRGFHLDAALRLNGDSPLNRPALLSRAVEIFRQGEFDLVSNVPGRTFPFGVSAEVIGRGIMELACARMTEDGDREHVTSFLYRHPELVKSCPMIHEGARISGVNLAVDQPLDVQRVSWIIGRLDDVASAPLERLVELAGEFESNSEGES